MLCAHSLRYIYFKKRANETLSERTPMQTLISRRNCFEDFKYLDSARFWVKMPPERRKNAFVRQFAAGIDAVGKLLFNSEGKEVWRCQKCVNSG